MQIDPLVAVTTALREQVHAAVVAITERDGEDLDRIADRIRALREIHHLLLNHPEVGKE